MNSWKEIRKAARTDSAALDREWLYNRRSELAAASIGTNHYGYAYDTIGNRLWASANADTNAYSANCLNQYASILRASVSPCEPSYDLDGNLTGDGVFTYAYDAENRLVSVTSAVETNGAIRVLNAYDHRHRRIRKIVQRLSLSVSQPPAPPIETREWQTIATHTYVWDGNLPVHETVQRSNGSTVERSYFWGMDKSGTEQGAGGVGGLLAVSVDGTFFIPCYDHNGNIVRYVSENGSTAAQYTYDPYGNVIEASGPLFCQFAFGFSTKYHDREIALVAYQRRFYRPDLGRWLNRDPIEEQGGKNLYAFCGNAAPYRIDPLGENLLDIHAQRIRAFLASDNEEAAAGEAYLLYLEIAMGGSILEPLAAQLMDNWLKGEDKQDNPFTISSRHVKNAMLSDKPKEGSPKSQLTAQLCAARDGNSGTKSNFQINLTATEGTYYHAFGTFKIFFTGTYKCKNGKVTFKGKWDFEDTYDWHDGLDADVLGTKIEDSWANLVQEYKGAHVFEEKGSWKGTVSVKCSSQKKKSESGR